MACELLHSVMHLESYSFVVAKKFIMNNCLDFIIIFYMYTEVYCKINYNILYFGKILCC